MAWANDTPSSGREGVKRVAIGACAWSYEDWRGVFYPEHLPAARRLEFYAKYLRAVEVDSTFYHAPKAQVTAHWNDVTPDAFRFACKLPREITHERRLRDSQELLLEFMQDLAPLGRKLACVLIQLPPSFSPKTDEHALREFVRELPGGARFAIAAGISRAPRICLAPTAFAGSGMTLPPSITSRRARSSFFPIPRIFSTSG